MNWKSPWVSYTSVAPVLAPVAVAAPDGDAKTAAASRTEPTAIIAIESQGFVDSWYSFLGNEDV